MRGQQELDAAACIVIFQHSGIYGKVGLYG